MTKRRPSKRPPTTTTTSTPTKSTISTSQQPTPLLAFTPAPSTLTPLLSSLPRNHIYILHLDPTPLPHRKNLFFSALALNAFLLGLILLRFYYAYPLYLSLLLQILGISPTLTNTDVVDHGWGNGWETVLYRMFTFLFDFLLLRIVGEWPYLFFTGPLWWRFRIGFLERGREVVVRRSRRWDEHSFLGVGEGREWWNSAAGAPRKSGMEKTKEGEEEEKARAVERIQEAVGRDWVEKKSGMVMAGREWDVDYDAMITAQSLLSSTTSSIPSSTTITQTATTDPPPETLQALLSLGPLVLAYSTEKGWHIHHPSPSPLASSSSPFPNAHSTKPEEQDNNLQAFKDELTRLGQESLFFRWVEVMQYESSTHGASFSRERAVEASRRCFSERGVSWDEIIARIGGEEELFVL